MAVVRRLDEQCAGKESQVQACTYVGLVALAMSDTADGVAGGGILPACRSRPIVLEEGGVGKESVISENFCGSQTLQGWCGLGVGKAVVDEMHGRWAACPWAPSRTKGSK